MSEQTLKFGDIVVNKQEFHASKQAIALNLLVHQNCCVCFVKLFQKSGFSSLLCVISLKREECFDFNHSLGSLPYSLQSELDF